MSYNKAYEVVRDSKDATKLTTAYALINMITIEWNTYGMRDIGTTLSIWEIAYLKEGDGKGKKQGQQGQGGKQGGQGKQGGDMQGKGGQGQKGPDAVWEMKDGGEGGKGGQGGKGGKGGQGGKGGKDGNSDDKSIDEPVDPLGLNIAL